MPGGDAAGQRSLLDRVESAGIDTCAVSDALDIVLGPAHGRGFVADGLRQVARTARPVAGFAVCAVAVADGRTPGEPRPSSTGIAELFPLLGSDSVLLIEHVAGVVASSVGGRASLGARQRGCRGIVVDGWVRDRREHQESGIPVWSRGTTPRSGITRLAVRPADTVSVGGARADSGDLVVVDDDGVCVVPRQHAEAVLVCAERIASADAASVEAMRAGVEFSAALPGPVDLPRRSGAGA